MRLIDADALNKAIAESRISLHTMRLKLKVSDILTILRYARTIDAVPVVHARWNEEDGTCSACCHEAFYDEWTEPKWDYDWDENLVQIGEETHIQYIFSPYCPNCGARMDGEENETD